MGDVVGVVLAAGTGSRFGDEDHENKLLAELDGEPIVRRAARSLAVDGVDRTFAVLGHEGAAVRDALAGVVDETIDNPDYDEGQSASVGLAARRASELDAEAVVYLPGDMPRVAPSTTRRLVAAYREADEPDTTTDDGGDRPAAFVPTTGGRRGNPVLFTAAQFDALESLSGDTGGRALFDDVDVRRVPVDDPGIHRDVDTVADLDRLRRSDEE